MPEKSVHRIITGRVAFMKQLSRIGLHHPETRERMCQQRLLMHIAPSSQMRSVVTGFLCRVPQPPNAKALQTPSHVGATSHLPPYSIGSLSVVQL